MLSVASAVIGAYVIYKRYMLEPCSTINMHFANPRGPHTEAHVQMHMPNEIRIQRHGNVTELVGYAT